MTRRDQSREELGALLKLAIPDFQEVYQSNQADFDGKTPVAALMSTGSGPTPLTGRGLKKTFFYTLNIWVLSVSEDDDWTLQDAENQLDDLRGQVDDFIGKNQRVKGKWEMLTFDDRSVILDDTLGGEMYLHEVVPLRMEVFA